MTFHPDDLPDLSGRVYIVTGGTSGIGYYTAARLAQHGAQVYICARSDTKGRKTIEGIQSLYRNAKLDMLVMDHENLGTVASAAKEFTSKETALHGLVNNAGIMATPYKMTQDGYEAQFQTNHIAHWLFTSHLVPIMLKTSKTAPTGTVRITNLTSGGYMMAPKAGVNFDDTSLIKSSTIARYGQSKLANILHAKILHQQYGPGSASAKAGQGEIWTSSIHPGIVNTGLDDKATEAPLVMKVLTHCVDSFGGRWPADKGAWTSVFCAASPQMKKEDSGAYYERIAKVVKPGAMARDLNLAEKLDVWTRQEMESKRLL
ncbi:hypothetical protein S40293_09130 [Stachybotrys chartarum IBT 40293]|nr:hypothetical protein S40293_09130 [Stachybotrys chartarum IBT 40293]